MVKERNILNSFQCFNVKFSLLFSSMYHTCILEEQLSAFETVCSQMLEDVQERLVYRTHIYIKSEILNYNPAMGDLAYPEKLEMMEVLVFICKI